MPEPTLLLVDPDDSARRALAALLQDAGYPVLEVPDGTEALSTARERPPGLVIVDPWPFLPASVQMMERLRSAATQVVPMLALTTGVSPEYRSRALAAGCVGYLEKPCPPERVLMEVRRILGPATAVADPV